MSFRVARGEVVGLLVADGAGESATVRRPTGDLLPTACRMAETEALCQRVGIRRDGRLAAIDTPAVLRGRVATRRSVAVTFKGTAPDPAEQLNGAGLVGAALLGGWRISTAGPGRWARPIARGSAGLGVELDTVDTVAWSRRTSASTTWRGL